MPFDSTDFILEPLAKPPTKVKNRTALEILQAARDRLAVEGHWCKGAKAISKTGASVFPKSRYAVSWCSVGAVNAESPGLTNSDPAGGRMTIAQRAAYEQAFTALNAAACSLLKMTEGNTINTFIFLNDEPATELSDVLKMFDLAILKLQKENSHE